MPYPEGYGIFFNLLLQIEQKMIKLRRNMAFEVLEVTSLPKDKLISSLEIAFFANLETVIYKG